MSPYENRSGDPVPSEHQTALIVHHSKAVADLLQSLLTTLPLSVAHASTPEEAKYLFNLLRPRSLILGLTDEWIPLLESFRSKQPGLEVTVLAQSDEVAEKARRMGFENVVIDDDNPETLIDGIQFFMGDRLTIPRLSNDITILVVDDEVEVIDILFRHLVVRGYTVRSARSGQMALEIIQGDPSISIVLLDLVMTEMGGIETLRKLKSHRKDLGVIMMSVFADREIVRQALNLGAFDFLLKPLDINQLEAVIQACLACLEYRKSPWWKRLAARTG